MSGLLVLREDLTSSFDVAVSEAGSDDEDGRRVGSCGGRRRVEVVVNDRDVPAADWRTQRTAKNMVVWDQPWTHTTTSIKHHADRNEENYDEGHQNRTNR